MTKLPVQNQGHITTQKKHAEHQDQQTFRKSVINFGFLVVQIQSTIMNISHCFRILYFKIE